MISTNGDSNKGTIVDQAVTQRNETSDNPGRLMFVYLSGTEKGKTRIFFQDHVTIGTSDACDLKLVADEGGKLPEGVIADIYNYEGITHLVPRELDQQLGILLNGRSISANGDGVGHILSDGDTLNFGEEPASAGVLFQVLPSTFSANLPARRTASEAERAQDRTVHPHPLTATLFVKELTASLWAEIPRKAKVIAMACGGLCVAIFVGIVFYFMSLDRKIELLGKDNTITQQQRQHDQETINNQQKEIERLRLASEQMKLYAQNVYEKFSPGVCLIVGTYTFVEKGTGRPLRYESADRASDPVDRSGNLLISVDGAGPAVQFEYTGTGFLVEMGMIATNKHVVQPWVTDQTAQIIMRQSSGVKPRLDTLIAFFPSIRSSFELRPLKTSDRNDLAVCAFPQGNTALPELPLSTEDVTTVIGESVVLLGYPTGVDGLLQRIEESERKAVIAEHGRSIADVAMGLANRGKVRPLTTVGVVSDALPTRIVHSAHTTEGGSGGPLLDREGRVIAINSAVLVSLDGGGSFGGSNFGVPIKALTELIEQAHQENTHQP